jgi:hypothetical protein
MVNAGLIKKLRMKPEHRTLILNAPEGYIEGISKEGEVQHIDEKPSGEYDFVHLFALDPEQLDNVIQLAQNAVIFDGLLWVSYPKGSSGIDTNINRDSIWQRLKSKGIRPVSQISIDDTWSSIRFRPTEQVGKK